MEGVYAQSDDWRAGKMEGEVGLAPVNDLGAGEQAQADDRGGGYGRRRLTTGRGWS